MDTISYHGHEYPVRVVDIPGWMKDARISTTGLNDELMNRDGSYVDDEGRTIDEAIFFYVEEEEFNLPDRELINIILKSIT